MKVEIKVPAMGESISEAVIGTLLKKSGDYAEADEELLELETDKVNQVLYAPQAGVVEWNIAPDEHVKIGQVIGFVDTDQAKKGGKAKPAAEQKEAPKAKSKPVEAPPAPQAAAKPAQ